MALHLLVLSILVDAALGAWLGVMAFFSFVGAPRAFAVYDEGGRYVNDVFPRYFRVGIGLGVVAVIGGVGRGMSVGFDLATGWLVAASAIGVVLFAYSLGSLIPRMEAAGEDGFQRYHRQSVVLNGLAMLAVATAIVAAHL